MCDEEGQKKPGSDAWNLKVVTSPTHGKLARLVTLVSNMKKSPWLLSRCKESPSHIQALINLLRPEDKITVAVKLESPLAKQSRYLVVVSTGETHVTQESAMLGIDVIGDDVTIGFVLPICDDMDIQMDGDGGFEILNKWNKYSFRPVSVQAMWSGLQSLIRAVYYARFHHQNIHRSTHAWVGYYTDHLNSPQDCVFEWNRVNDDSFGNNSQGVETTEDIKLKLTIKRKLRDIMTNEKDMDLETVTSKYVRERLEEALNVDLRAYRRFVDEEMVIVMRQMDSPSQILDFLYLGSEWNASNFEELQQNKIGYILNVTREVDNFFPGVFKYCNVRVDDTEETQLIRHWSNTNEFIAEAKKNNSRILVHCKMGISRSASTVIAYVMKSCSKSFLEAYQHVKQKRKCIKPNSGFVDQLNTFEGILCASKQRHNKLFRSRSAEALDDKLDAEQNQDERPVKRPKKDDEEEEEADTKKDDSNSDDVDGVPPIPETSPVDADSTGPTKSRPATFSIDSLDAFSPGTIETIAELKTEEDEMKAHVASLVTVVTEEDEDVPWSNEAQEDAGLLPVRVLDDPTLPVTSMLRKLSIRLESADDDPSGIFGKITPLESSLKEEFSLTKVEIRKRALSWPCKQKDQIKVTVTVNKDVSILRPTANRHRKLRGQRSNTVAYD